jgi:hypothetical protein
MCVRKPSARGGWRRLTAACGAWLARAGATEGVMMKALKLSQWLGSSRLGWRDRCLVVIADQVAAGVTRGG